MTTQVLALSANMFGQASDSSVRRIGLSSSAFRLGGCGVGSGHSCSSTGNSATAISDISAPRRNLVLRLVFPYHARSRFHLRGAQGGPARLQVQPIDDTNDSQTLKCLLSFSPCA